MIGNMDLTAMERMKEVNEEQKEKITELEGELDNTKSRLDDLRNELEYLADDKTRAEGLANTALNYLKDWYRQGGGLSNYKLAEKLLRETGRIK